jgi:hypothetical protein
MIINKKRKEKKMKKEKKKMTQNKSQTVKKWRTTNQQKVKEADHKTKQNEKKNLEWN